MANDILHELFHKLFGAINGLDLMSQICAQFVTLIKIDKLEGKTREEMKTNFENLSFYQNRALKDLESLVNALTETNAMDIGSVLNNSITTKLIKVGNIISNSEILYGKVLNADTKENLVRFARELEKIEPICQSMAEIMTSSKQELVKQGEY